MGNCLITQKGGAISDDDMQAIAKVTSYSRRNTESSSWQYICKEKEYFTVEERAMYKFGNGNFWDYKFFDKGTYQAYRASWWDADPYSGTDKLVYKFIGGVTNLIKHLASVFYKGVLA